MSEKVLSALDKVALELQHFVAGGQIAHVVAHAVIVDVVGALHELREAIAEERMR